MKILVTGATGLVGRQLLYQLTVAGHEVRALVRRPDAITELPQTQVTKWTGDEPPDPLLFSEINAVVHLAGENIGEGRWSKSRKEKLWKSRVGATEKIILALEKLPPSQRPKVLVSASAIGIYGSENAPQDEDSPAGTGFLSDLCREWEAQSHRANIIGIRTVILRTGLVLSREGGVLAKSGPVVLGHGSQLVSWIHIIDLVNFILFSILNPKLKGAYNLTTPNAVTHIDFTKLLAKCLGFPFVVRVPTLILRVILGELTEAILANQHILPKRTLASGFKFKFAHLETALTDLFANESVLDNRFLARQFVPRPRSQVFPFFGAAENLEVLTPPWLHFHIVNKSNEKIQEGSRIDYKLVIHGVPVRWQTLISRWNPEELFVDEQIKGPYNKWYHLHTFETVLGGTLISDRITFRLPGWLFGKLALGFVRRDIVRIFKYRQEKINSIYSPVSSTK